MVSWKIRAVAGVAVLLGIGSVVAAQKSPASPDPKSASSLSSVDQTSLAVSTLGARDASLEKFSCEVIEDDSSVDGETGATNQIARKVFTLKRSGESTVLTADIGESAGARARWTLGWDGALERAITALPDGQQQRGSIHDVQLPVLQQIAFFQILGLRARDQNITLPRWLTHLQFDQNHRISALLDPVPGASILVLDVSDDTTVQRYWINPDKGGMIIKSSFVDPQFWENQIVEDAEKFGDLWFATKVTCRRGNRDGKGTQFLQSFTVTRFTPGLDGDEATVIFPAGVHVVDYVRRRAFTPDAQGHLHPLPFYDPALGTVTMDSAGLNEATTHPSISSSSTQTSASSGDAAPDLSARQLADASAAESIMGDWIRAFVAVAAMGLLIMASRLTNSWWRVRHRYSRRRS